MVESLVKLLNGSPVLIDYAYGGATINNSLEAASVPAGADQTKTYLADVKSKSVTRGKGRVLHVVWNGINPLTAIWLDWIKSNNTAKAQKAISANVQSLLSQIQAIDAGAQAGVSK